MTELWYAIILGIVEGITEFLPISSTGHLLLCQRWMGISMDDSFWKMFAIFIQIGAILAVVVYFRERIFQLLKRSRRGQLVAATPLEVSVGGSATDGPAVSTLAESPSASQAGRYSPLFLVLIATAPVLVIGFLTHKWVEQYLETARVIAIVLFVGGLIMALIEYLRPAATTREIEGMTLFQAIGIGCAQVLAAVFPGTSRSAATIMAGMVAGLDRATAAEFSFFLAIPAMFAACGYSLLKQIRSHAGMTSQQAMLLAVGTLVSFLVAWVVIAGFMNFIRKHSFVPFAVYRILLAAVVFWALW
ncbi:MAG: undecaprenyl-diphosphate phosphatase [Phycisphaerales bacterium]|nr:undecaprenyl-diphosphate phosphatase [Phycisphaerales bacterium]